jgi:excisionase family DNA binding protein
MCEADEKYLTMREAAEVVRVSEAAMRERWRRLKLPVTRFGRNVLIAKSVLMVHLREQAVR